MHYQVGRWLIVCHDEYGQRHVAQFLSCFRHADAFRPQPDADDPSAASDAVAALNAPVGPLNLASATLREAFDLLSERTSANLVPYWDRGSTLGLWRDAKVRLQVDHASLGQVLSILCAQAGPSESRNGVILRPAHFVRGNRIEVLGMPAPPPEQVLRVYDLRPLIEEVLAFRRARPAVPRLPAGDSVRMQPEWTPSALLGRLRTCLVEGVARDTWIDDGGTGRADVLGGRLVVLQTPEVQTQVADFLRKLRKAGSVDGEPLLAP
ncbi:MAG TPA: hypothetical protein VGI81_19385 [Tepidisphaeraceae bacterium]